MASLDSCELRRCQTRRSAADRWTAAVETLLLKNRAAVLANLLPSNRRSTERIKRKTAGILGRVGERSKKVLEISTDAQSSSKPFEYGFQTYTASLNCPLIMLRMKRKNSLTGPVQ
ncbi:uncharacterized [Tachysurus ichikawai]